MFDSKGIKHNVNEFRESNDVCTYEYVVIFHFLLFYRSPSRDVADRVLFREENGARHSRPASSDILVSDIPSGELEEDTFLAHLESQIYPDDADMPQR